MTMEKEKTVQNLTSDQITQAFDGTTGSLDDIPVEHLTPEQAAALLNG